MDYNIEKIKLFESESFKNLTTQSQFTLFGIATYMLYLAIEEYDRTNKIQDAWYYLTESAKMVCELDCPSFWDLRHAVAFYMSYCEDSKRLNEYYYQELFKKHCSKIIPYCKLLRNVKTDKKNIPDAFIEINDNILPVEVKLHNFNSSALNQLNRYIKAYNSFGGIAVGRKLTVELSDNIQFISLDLLEEIESKENEKE